MGVRVAVTIAALALFPVNIAVQTNKPEDDVVATVRTFVKAIETADLTLLSATFDQDATAFMPGSPPPERRTGKAQVVDSFRGLFEQVRAREPGPQYATITPRDMVTQLDGDTAVVTFHLSALPVQPIKEATAFPGARLFCVGSGVAG